VLLLLSLFIVAENSLYCLFQVIVSVVVASTQFMQAASSKRRTKTAETKGARWRHFHNGTITFAPN
jgi:hypothetical protein